MTHQEQIENRLIDKTIQQRNEILENAQERAATMLSRAEAEKKRIQEQTQQAIANIIGGEIRAVYDRIVGGAQLQGRKVVMDARMDVISQVFNKVEENIQKLVEGTEWNLYLIKLVSESINKLGEDCIVYANRDDFEYLKANMELLPTGFKVKIEPSPFDIVGGVTVVNLEGTKTIHNTLDERLTLRKQKITAQVAEILGVI